MAPSIDIENGNSSGGKRNWKGTIKELLVLGLLTLAPIVVTFWILISVVTSLDSAMYQMFPILEELPIQVGFGLPGLGILSTFLLLLLVGTLTKTFLGRFFNSASDTIISRVPILRSVYKLTKQLSSVFFSKSPTSGFKKVVWIPFPHQDSKCLAFVASETPSGDYYVFVPTAPNPTSGYVLLYRKDQVAATDMTVDSALKLILSCGALGEATNV